MNVAETGVKLERAIMPNESYNPMTPEQVTDRIAFDVYMDDCVPSERAFEKEVCPPEDRGVLSMAERLAFRRGFRAALRCMGDAVIDQLSISPTEN